MKMEKFEENSNFTEEAIQEIKDFYVESRNNSKKERNEPLFSPRHLKALMKMSEAIAKINQNQKVTKEDAKEGIKLIKSYEERLNEKSTEEDYEGWKRARKDIIIENLKATYSS